MNSVDSARSKLWEMIRKYRFAMMTTQQGDGGLRSRPMTTIERPFDGALWFFAAPDSAAATALTEHPHVCLSYADSDRRDFVSVAGAAEVIRDAGKKKELWNPMVQAWFPAGPESPSSVLIRVVPDHAEYWDSTSSKLVQLFGMAKAIASGTQPRNIGEHRDVPMSGS